MSCTQACAIVWRLGFEFRNVSRGGESFCYGRPGWRWTLRLSTHGRKTKKHPDDQFVAAGVGFGAFGHVGEHWCRISDDGLRAQVESAIGRYFLAVGQRRGMIKHERKEGEA